MNDQMQIGSLFVTGLSGSSLSKQEAEQLSLLRPSGIILFKHNIDTSSACWQDSLVSLLADAKSAISRDDLLISIDHEGGRVHRFPDPVTRFPAAAAWGDYAEDATRAMAQELRSLGFNLSFAPVLDVLSEPTNKVIGDRAFSSDPQSVASAGAVVISTLHSEGVVACGKHFPGHGATFADSHEELPVLDVSKRQLEERELIPFKSSIDAGLRLMMSAHVLYPQLDKVSPATFSSSIIEGLLRKDLRFPYTVISDDLEMLGAAGVSLEQRGVQALNAGVDLLLAGNPKDRKTVEHAISMANGITAAIKTGALPAAKVDEALNRVSALRKFAAELDVSAEDPREHAAILGCEKHRALCEQIKQA